jgi:hypothetical protein
VVKVVLMPHERAQLGCQELFGIFLGRTEVCLSESEKHTVTRSIGASAES